MLQAQELTLKVEHEAQHVGSSTLAKGGLIYSPVQIAEIRQWCPQSTVFDGLVVQPERDHRAVDSILEKLHCSAVPPMS